MKKLTMVFLFTISLLLCSCSNTSTQDTNTDREYDYFTVISDSSTDIYEDDHDNNCDSNMESVCIVDTPVQQYTDEYGLVYVLVDGTHDQYVLSGDYEPWFETPESTAISSISYWLNQETLYVTFRNSGDEYAYYGVPVDVWKEFCDACSKGSYLNDYIKGFYDYERIG